MKHSNLDNFEKHDLFSASSEAFIDDIQLKIYVQRGMMAVKIPEKEKKLLNILFHTAGD